MNPFKKECIFDVHWQRCSVNGIFMTGNRLNGQESVTLGKELIDGVENLSKFVRKQSFISSPELDNTKDKVTALQALFRN